MVFTPLHALQDGHGPVVCNCLSGQCMPQLYADSVLQFQSLRQVHACSYVWLLICTDSCPTVRVVMKLVLKAAP
jgi:hypothetical protein